MTTKYTPAPWQAYNAIGGRILNRWHVKGGNKSLASVHAQDSSEEEVANALLIAAAPELAEALKNLLSLQYSPNSPGCEQARHALQSAGLEP